MTDEPELAVPEWLVPPREDLGVMTMPKKDKGMFRGPRYAIMRWLMRRELAALKPIHDLVNYTLYWKDLRPDHLPPRDKQIELWDPNAAPLLRELTGYWDPALGAWRTANALLWSDAGLVERFSHFREVSGPTPDSTPPPAPGD